MIFSVCLGDCGEISFDRQAQKEQAKSVWRSKKKTLFCSLQPWEWWRNFHRSAFFLPPRCESEREEWKKGKKPHKFYLQSKSNMWSLLWLFSACIRELQWDLLPLEKERNVYIHHTMNVKGKKEKMATDSSSFRRETSFASEIWVENTFFSFVSLSLVSWWDFSRSLSDRVCDIEILTVFWNL